MNAAACLDRADKVLLASDVVDGAAGSLAGGAAAPGEGCRKGGAKGEKGHGHWDGFPVLRPARERERERERVGVSVLSTLR